MAMKCPACGGQLAYNIDKDKLVCAFCDSEFDADEYKQNNEADYSQIPVDDFSKAADEVFLMDTYICKNCGAQLNAPSEQAVAYCAYCGGEAVLNGSTSQWERPRDIIPFKVSKKEVVEEYKKEVWNKLFVPAEFKKPLFIEGFRGIYMPYWRMNINIPQQTIQVKGNKNYTSGNYDYHETYLMNVTVGGEPDAYAYDASVAFDDTVASEIAPYDTNACVPFNEGYVAGLYMDRVTTPANVYSQVAVEQAAEGILEGIEAKSDGVKAVKGAWMNELGITNTSASVSLFPVWFLTWRKGKRVAYSVMNGQTGKMTTDLPVDKSKFFITAGIIALILFGLLSVLPIFILPLKLAAISSVLLFVSSILLRNEMGKIKNRETHAFDFGYQDGTNKLNNLKRTKKGLEKALGWIVTIGMLLFTFVIVTTPGELKFLFFIMVVSQIINTIFSLENTSGIKNKFAIFPVVMCIVIQVMGFIIADKSRPHDYWHYGISIMCLAGMLVNALTCIFYMNYLTTRPVPNFFRREGADNGREK